VTAIGSYSATAPVVAVGRLDHADGGVSGDQHSATSGHTAAHSTGEPDGERGFGESDQSELDGLHGQRGRHTILGRTVPGSGCATLRRSRHRPGRRLTTRHRFYQVSCDAHVVRGGRPAQIDLTRRNALAVRFAGAVGGCVSGGGGVLVARTPPSA